MPQFNDCFQWLTELIKVDSLSSMIIIIKVIWLNYKPCIIAHKTKKLKTGAKHNRTLKDVSYLSRFSFGWWLFSDPVMWHSHSAKFNPVTWHFHSALSIQETCSCIYLWSQNIHLSTVRVANIKQHLRQKVMWHCTVRVSCVIALWECHVSLQMNEDMPHLIILYYPIPPGLGQGSCRRIERRRLESSAVHNGWFNFPCYCRLPTLSQCSFALRIPFHCDDIQ